MLQLHDTMALRSGTILLGQPFSGKSTALNTLSNALTILEGDGHAKGRGVCVQTIYPNSLTLARWLGERDAAPHEWKVGRYRNIAYVHAHGYKWTYSENGF